MPWDSSPFNGFSTGDPWIASEPRPPEHTVEGQQADPDAPLHRYRSLLAVRRRHPDMWRAPLEWIETPDPEVTALRRGTVAVVANLSGRRADVSLGSPRWEPAFASHEGSRLAGSAHDAVSVPAETTVVLAQDHPWA